jgi:hypothetical protein
VQATAFTGATGAALRKPRWVELDLSNSMGGNAGGMVISWDINAYIYIKLSYTYSIYIYYNTYDTNLTCGFKSRNGEMTLICGVLSRGNGIVEKWMEGGTKFSGKYIYICTYIYIHIYLKICLMCDDIV